jgi:hypothetical protein
MEKINGYIYKIVNPIGRIYIGKTTNYKNRFRAYKNLHCKTQPALFNSLNKYGYENHIVEIIEVVDNNLLNEREKYYIKFFNSFNDGLNCTLGGDSGFLSGDQNCSKTEKARLENSRRKLEWHKTNKHPRLGIKHTDEVKEIIKLKRKQQEPIIRCYVLDLESGIFYNGIKELSDSLGLKYKSFFSKIKYTNCYKNKYVICLNEPQL